MNLVELIKDQLSSGVIKHLSSQIDASEGATRSAVFAAVPALLSALSGLASGGSGGSQKLVSALESFGSGSIESLTHKMSNQPGTVLEQGASILSSLFRNSTISGIVNILSRFASLAPGATQFPYGPPPAEIQGKRRVAAQPERLGDIRLPFVDLLRPRPGADDPARSPEPAMQDIQQRSQHDHVADPAEPDHDRLHGGRRHDSS